MKDSHLALAAISLLVRALGMAYRKIKRSALSETIFGLALGIFLGPPALDPLEVQDWGSFEKILQVGTELTLSMALMATAFRIPKDLCARSSRSPSSRCSEWHCPGATGSRWAGRRRRSWERSSCCGDCR